MATLASGLPDQVADGENLSRFLTQSNQFTGRIAKPAAFLPNPKYRNTSVFRIGAEVDRLRQVWSDTTQGERTLKAVAIVSAASVRTAGLDLIAVEPPPAHANIEGWPWLDHDPELQKARQKERAAEVASGADVIAL